MSHLCPDAFIHLLLSMETLCISLSFVDISLILSGRCLSFVDILTWTKSWALVLPKSPVDFENPPLALYILALKVAGKTTEAKDGS